MRRGTTARDLTPAGDKAEGREQAWEILSVMSVNRTSHTGVGACCSGCTFLLQGQGKQKWTKAASSDWQCSLRGPRVQ